MSYIQSSTPTERQHQHIQNEIFRALNFSDITAEKPSGCPGGAAQIFHMCCFLLHILANLLVKSCIQSSTPTERQHQHIQNEIFRALNFSDITVEKPSGCPGGAAKIFHMCCFLLHILANLPVLSCIQSSTPTERQHQHIQIKYFGL